MDKGPQAVDHVLENVGAVVVHVEFLSHESYQIGTDHYLVDDFQSSAVLPGRFVRVQELHDEREEDFRLCGENVVVFQDEDADHPQQL